MAMPSSQQIKAPPVEMPVDVFKAAIKGDSGILLPRLGLQKELEQTEIQVIIEATSPTSQQIETTSQTSQQIEATSPTSQQIEATSPTSQQIEATSPTSQQIEATSPTSQQIEATSPTSQQIEATSPTSQQIEATSPTSEQIEATSPTSEQIEATSPTSEQIEATSPTSEQIEVTSPTSEQIEATSPTSEQIEATSPTSQQIEATSPTSQQIEATSPTSQQIDATSPTSQQIEATSPTSEQIEATSPTSEQIEATSPTSEQIEATSPTSQQIEVTSPTSQQIEATSPTSQQIETTSPTSQQIEVTSPTSQQIEADDQHADRDILGSVTHFGDTLLHLLVTKKHNELALIVFQSDKSLLKVRNKDFETPLHCAAKVGNQEVIHDLIELDREFVMESVRETNSNKDTALHVAAKHGHKGVADELMELDPRVAYMVNKEEFSPLYLAIVGGYTDMVKNMLNSDSSLACQEFSNGMFPVHVAAQVGNHELVEHFMEKYPDDAQLLDRRGWNLFHFAADENNLLLIVRLKLLRDQCTFGLINFLALINAKDYEGNTPLHVASMKGHASVMKMICEDMDRREMAVNNQGLTAFHLSKNQIMRKASEDLRDKIISYAYLNKGHYFSSEWFDEIMESDVENKWERVHVIGLGSVLITTVTFAAAFTIPGGYNQDLGTPILGRKYAFKAFILANTQSFIQAFMSLLTLVLNAQYNLSNNDLRYATYTFIAAASCMVLAFGLGSYVILAPVSLPIAIIVLVYSLLLGSPFMYTSYEGKYRNYEGKYRKMYRALFRSSLPIRIRIFFGTLKLDKIAAWPILGLSLLGIFLIALA